MKNVFYLSEESRWKYLKKNAKQNDIALKIDTARRGNSLADTGTHGRTVW